MNIHEKLSKIQFEFKAKKSRYNSFGRYNFRSAEDILEALKQFNDKYKVYFTVTETIDLVGAIPVMTSIAAIHDVENGESVSCTALVGVDLNQKGMQVPQQFGSASSYGKKYALGNLLLIDDTADADATNTHGNKKNSKPKLDIGSDALQKAKAYIKNGGDIVTIENKYTITDAARKELLK